MSNLTDQSLREAGVFGRALKDGKSMLEERQRNQLDRMRERVLEEGAAGPRFGADDIKGVWAYQDKFGDLSIKKLSEAVAETQLPQLLRFGVQNFLFDG